MIYFVLAALALGFVKAEKGAVLELTGDAPTVHFGELGGSNVLTLVHSPAEEKLTCSGILEASDVRINGTSTTVADLISRVATFQEQIQAMVDWDAPIDTTESSGMPDASSILVSGPHANYYDAHHPRNAFDGAISTYWHSEHSEHSETVDCQLDNEWLSFNFSSRVRVAGYSITSRGEPCCHEYDSPRDWVLQGYRNESSWSDLHVVRRETKWGQHETRRFGPIQHVGMFAAYRLHITATNGPRVNYNNTLVCPLVVTRVQFFRYHWG